MRWNRREAATIVLGLMTAAVPAVAIAATTHTERDRLLDIFDRLAVKYRIEVDGRIAILPDGDNVTGRDDAALELTFDKAGRLAHIGLWHRDDLNLAPPEGQ